MAKRTLQERFIEALAKEGHIKTETKSRKFIPFRFQEREGWFYYVGKSGSLRMGQTIANSRPVSRQRKDVLLASVPE